MGLETAHNLLVDFLWDRHYPQVYVLPPRMVQYSRERYRLSDARSDPSDAFVIADVLRTGQKRLQPSFPDALLTRQILAKVSLIDHLTNSGASVQPPGCGAVAVLSAAASGLRRPDRPDWAVPTAAQQAAFHPGLSHAPRGRRAGPGNLPGLRPPAPPYPPRRSWASSAAWHSGFGPRRRGAKSFNWPTSRWRRHLLRCGEYDPSHCKRESSSPFAHCSASYRMRSL